MRKLCPLPLWLLMAVALCLTEIPAATGASFFPGVSPTNLIWPGGTIPYLFDTNFPASPAVQAVYLDVMREWELAANIHLVPYTGQSNYLLLRYNPSLGSGFCLLGNPVIVSCAAVSRGYAHEMGHALGFAHEHQRIDRTNYVTINYSNIFGYDTSTNPEVSAFVVETNDPVYGAYDFESIMHYARNAFSVTNDLDTIDPLAAYTQKYYYRLSSLCLSVGDFAAAAYLYGAPTNSLTNVVTNTLDVGFGTLRAAIYYANINPGTTIRFNISTNDPGYSNGVWTIYTTGELPPLVGNGTIIDGSTQPGFAGHPVIVLDGSRLLPEAQTSSGLYVYQASCVIKNLGFDNFTDYGVAFATYSATNNVLQGCYVGVDGTGTNAAPNNYAGALNFEGAHMNTFGPSNVVSGNFEYGILVRDTNAGSTVIQGNYIGLDATGTHGISNWYAGVGLWDMVSNTIIGGTNISSRNVISGNGTFGGIYITGTNNSNTVIQGNYIGPAANGSSPVTNWQVGIYVQSGAQNVTIGGTNAGAGNLISGNDQDGIFYYAPGPNQGSILGNFIGTDKTGASALGNGDNGIDLTFNTANIIVGGNTAAARNIVSANGASGIVMSDAGTSNITILGNYVGVASNGTTALGNTDYGIYVTQGPGYITIGGTNAGAGNLVSGNKGDGIGVYQAAPNSVVIQGNIIGADKTGAIAVSNLDGVSIDGGSQGVVLGGTTPAARNLISGNNAVGVGIYDSTTTGNSVLGNYIGVTSNGLAALPNTTGVYISFAQSNTVGGTATGASNIISGNSADGMDLYAAVGNIIQGNYIGVDKSGATALGNLGVGVSMDGGSQSNTLGGTAAGAGNIIAASGSHGVAFYGSGTSANFVEGNYIGVDHTGLNAIANNGCGLLFSGGPSANTIGGITAAARNVIGNSAQSGVYFYAASNNLIEGNYIGVNASGNTALSNVQYGIYMVGASAGNVIGGSAAGAGNVIAASGFNGVFISDPGTTGNLFEGNYFGVGANGVTPLGNGGQCFWIQSGASNNVIGLSPSGAGAGNIIACSQDEGIIVWNTNTVGDTIRGNLIYSNGAIGINLVGGTEDSYGTTANHVGGAVPGPNDLQNYPVITSASVNTPNTTVSGTLNSTANRSFVLDFYRDLAPDKSGHGQGQIYEGSTTVTTDASGNANFSYQFSYGTAGQYYAVTATDMVTGNTSEFSADIQSTNGPSAPVIRGPFTFSAANGFGMNVAVSTGQGYHVQATTNVASTNWINLTNFTASGTNYSFTDRSATNLTRRFYRVVSP